MATIFDLPVYDVLFARIFCYLDAWEIWRIKTVSARFNRICWKYFKCFLLELNVDLSTFEIGKDATAKLAAAKVIARISSQLKMFTLHLPLSVIHLLGQRNDVETLFTVIAHASPQLSRLCIINLDSLPFGLTTAKHLGLCCGQLTELVLCNINPTDIDFDILLLSILDHQINAMTKLTLSTVKLCHQDTLRKSAFKTPNLKSLTMNNIGVDNQVLSDVFKVLPKLEVVDLRYCFSLDERTIRILVEFCSQLKELYLTKTNLDHSMSPELIKSIFSHNIHVDMSIVTNNSANPHVLGQI